MIAELLGVAELIGSILRRASVGGRPSWVEPNTRVRTYSVGLNEVKYNARFCTAAENTVYM